MKKVINFLLVVSMFLFISACGGSRQEVAEEVADSTLVVVDSTVTAVSDTLAAVADSVVAVMDSVKIEE